LGDRFVHVVPILYCIIKNICEFSKFFLKVLSFLTLLLIFVYSFFTIEKFLNGSLKFEVPATKVELEEIAKIMKVNKTLFLYFKN
jgi:hypothetical protein